MKKNIDNHPELQRTYENPEKNLSTIHDFMKGPFEQLIKHVPLELQQQFHDRFLKHSSYLFPMLIFFYLVRHYPNRIKENDESKNEAEMKILFEECSAKMIQGRRTYVWALPEARLHFVFSLGHISIGKETESSVCNLSIYKSDSVLAKALDSIQRWLADSHPILTIQGTQQPEEYPGCCLIMGGGSLNEYVHLEDIGEPKQIDKAIGTKFDVITEIITKLALLKQTSTLYEVKILPITKEGSPDYGDKKVVEEKK